MSLSRYLRPDRFEVDPAAVGAETKWIHWLSTFENFLTEDIGTAASEKQKLSLLINHISPALYDQIRECADYKTAINILNNAFERKKNIILSRYVLITRKQRAGETIQEFTQALRSLSYDCHFASVSAEEYKNEVIRGTLIAGLLSTKIRERLLERNVMTLQETLNLALSLESSENAAQAIESNGHNFSVNAAAAGTSNQEQVMSSPSKFNNNQISAINSQRRRCYFCGGNIHQRNKCPAFHLDCQLCSKRGHIAKVCRSSQFKTNAAVQKESDTQLSIISAASPTSLQKATITVYINTYRADALVDTGSTISFINNDLVQPMKLKRKPYKQTITLASLNHVSYVNGLCHATIQIGQHVYKNQPLLIVDNLCADIIIGHDLLKNHSSLELQFGGEKEPLKICNVMEASVPPASIFTNLATDMKPIAVRSRRHSEEDKTFISNEISLLLKDKVIEPSVSPWRAQVLVAGGGNHKKRLVIDYSQTINRYTNLDAYPLPSIDSVVSQVAKHNYFSQIDLKSAYHQVPILPKEKMYTAFEAGGNLYQFTRIPFGVTNGVAAFQRTLNYIIKAENLKGTYAYLDDVTICGKDKEDHDINLRNFMEAARKYRLTLNTNKSTFSTETINLLGYTIHNNTIKPDKSRLEPLVTLPIPTDASSLKRALGLFAHYSKWIVNFSAKIRPLVDTTFPLSKDAVNSFNDLKSDIAQSALAAIDDKEPFSVETDASEYAIAATLSQKGRPVAFFSRTLNDSERRQPSIEKEASAIVEALRKWRHYLIARHFILITDQQSVSFMFNQKHCSKIKNEKIERWRLELSCYKYDIVYRPGKLNQAADALSRVTTCAFMNSSTSKLLQLHTSLCHPGVTRMLHWIRTKNLPFSVDEVKKMTASCPVCAEIKPRYVKNEGHLIKAIAPFDRLNLDFKGPIPSTTPNKYILTVIDEYSRFPFAFACKDVTTESVKECLTQIFLLFGTPAYIHSDRGASFMSDELKKFLSSHGVACSRTSPYNPQGNGLVERLNGTLWRTIQLYLRSNNLDVTKWEEAIPVALHSIRSLLSTGTNATPHERMFTHPRRSVNGQSMPTWLLSPGRVYMKKNRNSKYDSAVEEVELLQSTPDYSYVRLPEGRETTVSNRRLAPLPDEVNDDDDEDYLTPSEEVSMESPLSSPEALRFSPREEESSPSPEQRRSTRDRRPPAYLADYDCGAIF